MNYALWLMERDRKSTPLKSLQGKIWEAGYLSGELRGKLYPDVAPAFRRWRAQGRRMAIFSSGSVLAQKLLFAHSPAGDLASFISAYFDTTTGPKQDAESYGRIAAALGFPPAEMLAIPGCQRASPASIPPYCHLTKSFPDRSNVYVRSPLNRHKRAYEAAWSGYPGRSRRFAPGRARRVLEQ